MTDIVPGQIWKGKNTKKEVVVTSVAKSADGHSSAIVVYHERYDWKLDWFLRVDDFKDYYTWEGAWN